MIKRQIIASILTILVSVFGIIIYATSDVAAQSETYSYANNGEQIAAKGGYFGNKTTILRRGFGDTNVYSGSVIITDGRGGECNIVLEVKTPKSALTPDQTSTISAPPYLNGAPVASSGQTKVTPNCSKEYAASIKDLNKSIIVSGKAIGSGQVNEDDVAETAAQKQIIVTVYSNKPPTERPKVQAVVKKGSETILQKDIVWNDTASVGSAYFENAKPGLFQVCLEPSTAFSYAGCQSVTKLVKKELLVVFGSSGDAYNEQGKLVDITVKLATPSLSNDTTYGPLDLEIRKIDGTVLDILSSSVTFKLEAKGPIKAMVRERSTSIDNVEPGEYIVCIESATICSSSFKKEKNKKAKVVLNISEEQAEQFLAKADNENSCPLGPMGWVVCPVASFLGMALDGAYGMVTVFMSVDSKAVAHTSVEDAWATIRTIANVAFVIAFLVIIYSQMTGMGLNNYNIKKIIPKVIISIIAVNLSLIICQLLVDISNLLGISLFNSIKDIVPTTASPASEYIEGILAGTIGITIAGLGAVALAIAGVGTVVPIILFGLAGVLMTIIILITRQGAIIILTVLSPLAFVALLLPNTESLFKKWWKIFFGLLVVFPAIALVFSLSKVASAVISGPGGFVAKAISLGVATIPLIVTPKLLRSSLDATGKLGAAFNQAASKMSGRSLKGLSSGAMKGAKESSIGQGITSALSYRRQKRDIDWAKRRSAAGGRMGKLYDALGGNKYSQHRAAQGYALQQKEIDEEVSAKKIEMENILGPAGVLDKSIKAIPGEGFVDASGNAVDLAKLQGIEGGAAAMLYKALENNDANGAKAATQLLKEQRGKGRQQLREVIRAYQQKHVTADTNGNITHGLNDAYAAMQTQFAGMKENDNVIDNVGYSNRTVDAIEKDRGTFSALTYQEMATQPPKDLQRAIDSGVIDAVRAAEILDNDTAQLTTEKRDMLKKVVEKAGPGLVAPTVEKDLEPKKDQNKPDVLKIARDTQTNDLSGQSGVNVGPSGARSRISDRASFPNQATENLSNRFNSRNK